MRLNTGFKRRAYWRTSGIPINTFTATGWLLSCAGRNTHLLTRDRFPDKNFFVGFPFLSNHCLSSLKRLFMPEFVTTKRQG